MDYFYFFIFLFFIFCKLQLLDCDGQTANLYSWGKKMAITQRLLCSCKRPGQNILHCKMYKKHCKIALQSFSDMLVLWLKGREGMVGHGLSFCQWTTIIGRIAMKDTDARRTTANDFGHYRSKHVHLFECYSLTEPPTQ